jgi:hypothetical protein
MDANDFEVRFAQDGINQIAWYDNGKWVRSETTTLDPVRLPTVVNDAIARNFAGYSIKDIEREETATQVIYEISLEKGDEKCKIHYTVDGNVAKKKCRNVDK